MSYQKLRAPLHYQVSLTEGQEGGSSFICLQIHKLPRKDDWQTEQEQGQLSSVNFTQTPDKGLVDSAHTWQSGFIMCVQLLSWTELPCQHMQHMVAQALVRKVRGCHSNDLQPSCLSTLSTLYLPMEQHYH